MQDHNDIAHSSIVVWTAAGSKVQFNTLKISKINFIAVKNIMRPKSSFAGRPVKAIRFIVWLVPRRESVIRTHHNA